MDEVEPLKTCKSCGIEKELDQFSPYKVSRDRLHYKCKKCRTADEKNRRRNNPMVTHRQRLRPYGLSVEQFQDMVDSQAGKCANPGCSEPWEFIDHDHNTGRVRQLLCRGCNTALGFLAEDRARILGLAEYAKRWQH